MKTNKKILMLGTAITSIVAPVAMVISCGVNNSAGEIPIQPPIPPTPEPPSPIIPTGIVLTIKNYKQYTTYDTSRGVGILTIKEGITEITNVFQNGYIPDPSKPNDTVPIHSLNLPVGTLMKIDKRAFRHAELITLKIPKSVITIGDGAFEFAKLTNLTIPNSVESIGQWAFSHSKLNTITFGKSLKTIGRNCFESAKTTSLVFQSGMKHIGMWAFASAPLTHLWIPNSVDNLGEKTFGNTINKSSTNITMPAIFNNGDEKNKIFTNGWDNINFTWT